MEFHNLLYGREAVSTTELPFLSVIVDNRSDSSSNPSSGLNDSEYDAASTGFIDCCNKNPMKECIKTFLVYMYM